METSKANNRRNVKILEFLFGLIFSYVLTFEILELLYILKKKSKSTFWVN